MASGLLALGRPASAQETPTEDGDGDDGQYRTARMYNDEFHSGGVVRVVSPTIDTPPVLQDILSGYTTRVVEYFNTNEEVYLFVPEDAEVQEGDLYVFGDEWTPFEDTPEGEDLVEVQYRDLGQEDFPFELEPDDDYELLEDEGGGEAAVRPSNFYAGGLFRITSGTQEWVPEDIAGSGLFTDYNTHHAEFLGTNDEFLLFPQEDAEVEVGRLYVMWEEFEFFSPAGNLVATEFEAVNEDSIDIDDDLL